MASVLPHNYEAIIKDADPTVVMNLSSIDKICKQLKAGVFLNQKRKKYWIEGKDNNNCFELYARNLSISWGGDLRYWKWVDLQETSDVVIEAAELLKASWLKIQGKFDTRNLSPGIEYQVAFVVLLKDYANGWEVPVNLRLILPDGNTQQHAEHLGGKPKNQWIEIPAGEFNTSPEKIGEIEFSLYKYGGCLKKGILVKGVKFRPKN